MGNFFRKSNLIKKHKKLATFLADGDQVTERQQEQEAAGEEQREQQRTPCLTNTAK